MTMLHYECNMLLRCCYIMIEYSQHVQMATCEHCTDYLYSKTHKYYLQTGHTCRPQVFFKNLATKPVLGTLWVFPNSFLTFRKERARTDLKHLNNLQPPAACLQPSDTAPKNVASACRAAVTRRQVSTAAAGTAVPSGREGCR